MALYDLSNSQLEDFLIITLSVTLHLHPSLESFAFTSFSVTPIPGLVFLFCFLLILLTSKPINYKMNVYGTVFALIY